MTPDPANARGEKPTERELLAARDSLREFIMVSGDGLDRHHLDLLCAAIPMPPNRANEMPSSARPATKLQGQPSADGRNESVVGEAVAAPLAAEQPVWLIERKGAAGPEWWSGVRHWSDALHAVHFASERSAQMALTTLQSKYGERWPDFDSASVTEHLFVAAPAPAPSAAPPEAATEGKIQNVALTDKGAVVLGIPAEGVLSEDESHNCDAMGCGTEHVLARVPFVDERAAPTETAGAVKWPEWMRDRDKLNDLRQHLVDTGWREGAGGEPEPFDQGACMAAEVVEFVMELLDAPPSAQQAPPPTGWMPIESAPKPTPEQQTIEMLIWCRAYGVCQIEWYGDLTGYWQTKGVTHWMPLPPPPKQVKPE